MSESLLPQYNINLKLTELKSDVPELNSNLTGNLQEIQKFINAIKECVEGLDSSETSGLTQSQVNSVISASRVRREIDGNKHTSVGTVTYDSGLDTEYTVTYSQNSGKHVYTVSNPYSTIASYIIFKDALGSIEYPHIKTTGTNIIITLSTKIDFTTKKYVTTF